MVLNSRSSIERNKLIIEINVTNSNVAYNSIFVEELAAELFWNFSAVYYQISFEIADV